MPIISETAYPIFKTNITEKDLIETYTPSNEEMNFIKTFARTNDMELFALITLKSFQRLGYFVPVISVPKSIIKYIASFLRYRFSTDNLKEYDRSRNYFKHIAKIREFLNVKPINNKSNKFLFDAMFEASKIKQDLIDIINAGIEQLIRGRYELPAFDTFLREAKKARAKSNNQLYESIYKNASQKSHRIIDELFNINPETKKSKWNLLKQDPGKATLKELKILTDRLSWLVGIKSSQDPFNEVPYVKIRHLALEAQSLDAGRIKEVAHPKRFVLASALIKFSIAGIVDDLCEMLMKRIGKIHNKGKEKLSEYLESNQETTDKIIFDYNKIHNVVSSEEDSSEQINKLKKIFEKNSNLVEFSKQYAIYGSKNYFRFLMPIFRNYRSEFFKILEKLQFVSTSSDKSLVNAIEFALSFKNSRMLMIPTEWKSNTIDLSWIPDAWWYLVTEKKRRKYYPSEINRKQFEACLFTQITQELNNADLCVEESEDYLDYRKQLIPWNEYYEKIHIYSEISGIPNEISEFIKKVQDLMAYEAEKLDLFYPDNSDFRIAADGLPSLKRIRVKDLEFNPKQYSELISKKMPARNILDILIDTQKHLNWTRVFGPVSGLEAKLNDPENSYIVTSFCYGCNLGPVQTAKSLSNLSRKQIAWINQRHITEENLQKAIEIIINAYNKFALPKCWGNTSSVSADGMMWDIYENNLLSEYHIRYGGYGGIGYYHVSDTYIALFSRFISCGVYEAIYILDPLFQNKSDIQPDTIHSDTHGQSLTVFGLAFLLGIQLMPRIKNWKSLKIFKSEPIQYENIDPLFTKENINWELIEKHLPDMLRIAISIHEGRIAPSVILRRLGTHSRKNRVFFAFQELGKAIRSSYLLKYLGDPVLRRKVNHATTVSEAFNNFIQFVSFGNKGIITENTRDQQRKIIRYGHLVANALIFMNVYDQSKILNEMIIEGKNITKEVASTLSPYRTIHINRFGKYYLDENREHPLINYNLNVISN